MKGRILIVDDKAEMLLLLKRIITEGTSHEVVVESSAPDALKQIRETPFDLIITDLRMPKMNGISLLEAAREVDPQVAVVIVTAYATIDTAVEATHKGAFDYITKPFRSERILLTIDKVMKWREVTYENRVLRETLTGSGFQSLMVGASPVMRECMQRVRQVAPTNATVLITGPSGTGKELIARSIHRYSTRSNRKLVTVNCTAIPESILESELFGHVKGAFSGAWKDKKGLAEEADGGTLFLDEIGDMSLVLQTKLLRLLQEGEYKPVGSVLTKKADLRIIAATNHDLLADIAARQFREDLFYRLDVIHLKLAPLKERKSDIPLLAYHFLKKYAKIHGKDVRDISPEAMQHLGAMEFPGNIRELENTIERGVIYCRGSILAEADLWHTSGRETPCGDVEENINGLPFRQAKEQMMRVFHRSYIERLLRENNGNVSLAAEKARIQRQYLHRLMKEAGLSSEDYRQKDE